MNAFLIKWQIEKILVKYFMDRNRILKAASHMVAPANQCLSVVLDGKLDWPMSFACRPCVSGDDAGHPGGGYKTNTKSIRKDRQTDTDRHANRWTDRQTTMVIYGCYRRIT